MEMVGDGGGGGGERRVRSYGNPSHQASLKCPRCESVNTKFCYYNNYNLSQPRHFCKSCRRYWTKGGVLRNVPVGGGCRKNKRSKSKNTDEAGGDSPRESKSRNKSSSSESSGLTAVAALPTTTMTPTSAEEGSAPGYATSKVSTVRDFSDSRIFDVNPGANRSYDRQPLENHPSTDGEIFAAEIGSFTNLMSSSEEAIGFGVVGDIPLTTSFDQAETVSQAASAAAVVENPVQDTVADAFTMEDVNAGGLAAALGWGDGVDHGRFDLTAGVDPADWSQHQWTVNDQSLHYFPYI